MTWTNRQAQQGWALRTNGGYVSLPLNADFDTPSAFGVECDIYAEAQDTIHSINKDSESPPNRAWIIRQNLVGDLRGLYHVYNQLVSVKTTIPTASWKVAEWFKMAFSCWYDGSVIQMRIWINGVLVGQDTAVGTSINVAGVPVRISYQQNGSRKRQIVRNFRFWNRMLTSEEVVEHNAGYLEDLTGLMAYIPFDDGKGLTARDISGRGNHATLVGTCEWTKSWGLPAAAGGAWGAQAPAGGF